MFDHGLILTAQAIRRQLAAMPHELYLVRLIHQPTQRPFPGERLWTAQQLSHLATIRFLRARNCEGCDIYVQPYSQDHNAVTSWSTWIARNLPSSRLCLLKGMNPV